MSMRRFKAGVVAGLLLAGICRGNAVEFHVAPSGSDGNAGTEAAPFATLEKARNSVRVAERGAAPAIVFLHGGDYVRTNAFILSSADTNCIYQAVPGETPRLLGGPELDPAWFTTVTSSSPVWSRLTTNAQGNVLEVNLAAHGITSYGTLKNRGFGATAVAPMELFVNGRPQTLARWPNAGSWATVATSLSSSSFTYSDTEPSRWTQAEEIWIHGYFYYLWADNVRKATNINTTTKTIMLGANSTYGIAAGKPYFACNLLEEIDSAGEYYIKRDTGKLYFWPSSGFAAAAVMVSVLETPLVQVTGARNIAMDGVEMLGARGLLVQVDAGTTNAVFSHCRLLGAGSHAASVTGVSNGFVRCEIADAGSSGVMLNGGDRYTLTPGGNFARQCDIHDFSRLTFTYAAGASLNGVGQIVEHCEISAAPHSALILGGNEHRFEYNNIHDVCRWTSDAGAIYTGRDWGSQGNKLRYNFLHDVNSGFDSNVKGFYLDDCASGLTVFGNVCYRIDGAALMNRSGRDNDWENNVVAGCGIFHYGAASGITAITTNGNSWDLLAKIRTYNYQSPPWSTAYPALAAIPDDYNLIGPYKPPGGTIFSRNVSWQNTTLYMWSENASGYYADMSNNMSDQNPLFVNESALDLTLKTNSPVFSIPGFQAIPFREIGVTAATWDANTGSSGAQDGAGVWKAGGRNWWSGLQEPWGSASPVAATFGAIKGTGSFTVTLGGDVVAGNLTFTNRNYMIAPDAGGLYSVTLTGSPTIAVATNAAISAPLAGTGFNKTGDATLALSGTNTLDGTTVIHDGRLRLTGGVTDIGANNLLVADSANESGTLTLEGGTLRNSGYFGVGWGANGSCTGIVNQTGGVVTGGNVILGRLVPASGNGYGFYNLSGGAFSANVLRIGNTARGIGAVTVSGAGTLIATTCFIGENGTGTFTMTGGSAAVGDVTLALNSDSSGVLNLNGGTLTVPSLLMGAGASAILNFNGGALKAGTADTNFLDDLTAANILGGGAVINDGGFAITVGQVLAGTGGLTKTGGGTLTLTASNTCSGVTTVSAGTLRLGDGAAANGSVAGKIVNNAALVVANPTAQTIANLLTGAGSLTKTGAGTLTVSCTNSYSGGTTISAGTVKVNRDRVGQTELNDPGGLGANSPANVVTVNSGAVLTGAVNNWFASSDNTDPDTISTLAIKGGVVRSGGRATSLGAVTVSGGTLESNGGWGGWGAFLLQGDVTVGGARASAIVTTTGTDNYISLKGTGGVRIFTVADVTGSPAADLVVNTELRGTSGLIKAGPGVMLLTASNSYSGTTTVSNGTLLVTGRLGGSGAVMVGSAGKLGGTGVITGLVTVAGTLAPGASPGTLTISNNLLLAASASLAFELGTKSDRVAVSGNLRLDGTLNVSDAGGFGEGIYVLFTYGGALTDNGLNIGSVPNGGWTYLMDNRTAGQVRLIAAATAFAAWQYWHFGGTGKPDAAAAADPDGDGMDNDQEFSAGTVPTNAASALRLTAIHAGQGVSVAWQCATGRVYQVKYTDKLPGEWLTNLPGSVLTPSPGDTNLYYTDTSFGAATNRFYRIRLLP